MSVCCIVCVYSPTIFERKEIYGKNLPQRLSVDTQYFKCHRKVGSMETRVSRALIWCYTPFGSKASSFGCIFPSRNYRIRLKRLWRLHLSPLFGSYASIYLLVCETCDELPAVRPRMSQIFDIQADYPPQIPRIEEFIGQKTSYTFCQKVSKTVGKPESAYSYEKDVFLVRRSHIYGSIQKVFPETLQWTML